MIGLSPVSAGILSSGGIFVPPFNVALASNGATATATSINNPGTDAPLAIDGTRVTNASTWTSAAAASSGSPQILTIDFGQSRTISEIDVFTLRDAYNNASPPVTGETFSLYGIKNFTVEYFNGAAWINIATVTANNLAWRQFTFTAVTTSRIRVVTTLDAGDFTRIAELEAWGN